MSFQSTLFQDVFHQALFSLRDNRLRTVLSVLGVAVGILLVMTVGSVVSSGKDYIYAELETYGLRSVWIYRDWEKSDPNRAIRQGSGISNEDYKYVSAGCCSAVLRATPVVYTERGVATVKNGGTYYDAPIEGVGVDYMSINNDELLMGRNFRIEDINRRKAVAIVGPKTIKKLFGKNTNALGKSIRLHRQKYTIIGIMTPKSRTVLSQIGADDYDINSRVLIPYTLYQNYMGSKDIHTLQAEARSMELTRDAMSQLKQLLERRHGNRYKYKTESMDGWINTANEQLQLVSLIGFGFASLALFVGGIGIMNIMSTSVIERTKEIGIRKAIGASNRDILLQFLMEAGVVSTIGGVIGLILGAFASIACGWFFGIPITPSWLTAIAAVLISALVGIISGYYPAHRAANLKPVDALRYE